MDLRPHFPALAEGLAHFDGPGGTQVPAAVADAVAAAYRSAISNRHGGFASSDRADAVVDDARQAAADLLGADPRGVVLGHSMTANTYVLAGALARTWAPGDEVVVSRLDHDANIRPWVQAAERAGATVRWADVDDATNLPAEQYVDLVTERTRLVGRHRREQRHRVDARTCRADRRDRPRRRRSGPRRRRARHPSPARPSRSGTSGPAAPTSGTARTSASPPPTPRCSRPCTPTSC